jgi:hypothetical protein
MEIATIASAITGIKNLFDIVDKIYDAVSTPSGSVVSEELKNELLGNESLAREQSAQLLQMVGAKTYPFLLRMGKSFTLPPDLSKMEEAVKAYEVWDWTYCYDCKNSSSSTIKHLRHLFCDPEDTSLLVKDACTTTLAFSESQMPSEFGDTLYIAGIVIGNIGYDRIYNIPNNYLLPAVVVKTQSGSTYGFNNPVAMNYYLKIALDYLFTCSPDFQHYGELSYNLEPENRKLPPQIYARLKA